MRDEFEQIHYFKNQLLYDGVSKGVMYEVKYKNTKLQLFEVTAYDESKNVKLRIRKSKQFR